MTAAAESSSAPTNATQTVTVTKFAVVRVAPLTGT